MNPPASLTSEPFTASVPKPLESTGMDIQPKKVRQRTQLDFGGIQELHEELLLDILCRVPVEELFKVCKYVCKSWLQLLDRARYNPSFINSNLRYSTPYMIFKNSTKRNSSYHIARFNGLQCHSAFLLPEFDIHEFCLTWLQGKIRASYFHDNRFHGEISATSCDGVLLICCGNYFVVNPLTRQLLQLPRINHCHFTGAIARIPGTGKFKVLSYNVRENVRSLDWYVLTIGTKMSWKLLSDIPPRPRKTWPFISNLVSINGVVYGSFKDDDPTFGVFDLHNETGYSLEIPVKCKAKQREVGVSWTLLNMIEQLGCAYIRCTEKIETVKLWVLKDLRMCEWSFMFSIDFLDLPEADWFYRFQPQIWFQSSEMLVLSVRRGSLGSAYYEEHWAYFFNTKKFQKLNRIINSLHLRCFTHRFSLAPLF